MVVKVNARRPWALLPSFFVHAHQIDDGGVEAALLGPVLAVWGGPGARPSQGRAPGEGDETMRDLRTSFTPNKHTNRHTRTLRAGPQAAPALPGRRPGRAAACFPGPGPTTPSSTTCKALLGGPRHTALAQNGLAWPNAVARGFPSCGWMLVCEPSMYTACCVVFLLLGYASLQRMAHDGDILGGG